MRVKNWIFRQKRRRFWNSGKRTKFSRSRWRLGKAKRNSFFYEGPPYANGRPGIHHVEARAFKDIILRYKTMRGFYAPRRAGWDTHGLPTEIEVEKNSAFSRKKTSKKKSALKNLSKKRGETFSFTKKNGKN